MLAYPMKVWPYILVIHLILILACSLGQPEPLPSPPALPPTETPSPFTTQEAASLAHISTANITQIQELESLSVETIDTLMARFLPANNQLPAKFPVDTYRIRFQTLDEHNELIEIRADLRFPRVETPSQFPIFVYGSGTTGIGNDCATLDEKPEERNWGNYRSHMLSYASQGYITILPNWQGYDDRYRTHPYFVAELEGRVMLDAARAVYNFFVAPPSPTILVQPTEDIFLGGYSQGGHGAFAGDVLAADYAPELKIRGIIGHATSPDVEGLMYDRPIYAPYIVYAYRDFYGPDLVDPNNVFLSSWLNTFDADASTKCIDEAFEYYSIDPAKMYTPEFFDALYNGQWSEQFIAFKEKLDLNFSGRVVKTEIPAIILHGEADPIVNPATVEKFVAKLCNGGKNVIYKSYPNVNHFQTRQRGFTDTLNWMQTILIGDTPESGCGAFFSQF